MKIANENMTVSMENLSLICPNDYTLVFTLIKHASKAKADFQL